MPASSNGGVTPGEDEFDGEPEKLKDLIKMAKIEGKFDFFEFISICFDYWEICFNPVNWFG